MHAAGQDAASLLLTVRKRLDELHSCSNVMLRGENMN